MQDEISVAHVRSLHVFIFQFVCIVYTVYTVDYASRIGGGRVGMKIAELIE